MGDQGGGHGRVSRAESLAPLANIGSHSTGLNFSDIESTHYGAWPLGHKKLDTTALYTRVAISAIGGVTSPLDVLLKMPG